MAETGTSRNVQAQKALRLELAIVMFHILASLKLAAILLTVLAVVLVWAAVLESEHSAAHTRWYVYESWWFVGLLILLGVNIFCSAASRFPRQWQRIGVLVTHAGVLVLLAGAVCSLVSGVDGRLSVIEGQTAHDLLLNQRSQITAFWVGRPQEAPLEFTFDADPVDWSADQTLNLGEVDGVKARILGYLRHPLVNETWVPDDARLGGPAVKFKVLGKNDAPVAGGWLVDQQYGDAVAVGPIRLQLERAVNDRMLDDFLHPNRHAPGENGLLVMYLAGAVERVSIDKQLGQKIALGQTGVTVEIAQYLPNARPDQLGNFTTKGDQPKNPMVELRVHVPDAEKPLRQIAFAKDPLLNLDGVYSRVCPVKFRFHHPAIQPQTAIELMQNNQGELFGRLCAAGAYTSHGELHAGDKLAVPGNFHVEVVEHISHARHKLTFAPSNSRSSPATQEQSEPAALVEITVGGTTEQVWLRRNDPAYGRSTITTPSGDLALSYGHGRQPLGFSLELIDIRRDHDLAAPGNSPTSSRVRVVDSQRGLSQERVISRNQPLTHGHFTIYESGYEDAGHGRESATFRITSDPGRAWKHCGGLTICLGLAIMLCMHLYFVNRTGPTPVHSTPPAGGMVLSDQRADSASSHNSAVPFPHSAIATGTSKPHAMDLGITLQRRELSQNDS